jgi:hypothetical protein
VSPVRTTLQGFSGWLGLFQPSDIQTIIANASGIKAAIEKYFQQLSAGAGATVPSLGSLGQQSS